VLEQAALADGADDRIRVVGGDDGQLGDAVLVQQRDRVADRLVGLDDHERRDLATLLRDVAIRFDNLWQMPFPYVMALHQAPVRAGVKGFHFHIEFHPPLRRPNLLKYLAGPEIGGGNFLSDTSPEDKAAELIAAGGPHYRSTSI
jgi:galactose-1-phosphate uridylyltransferase